ncbi:hypothetical protein BJY14_008029 [Actinomadura luteofluorescens]|uniref:Uncharacterized protein n=2 Tax=Actinomadura luteofluorescens TaxID=46163 RepID=A0A7Y9EQM9_9ACTN|nr:hypothetical protein [Actinomadura luteofluorescens]NYD52046.1 hypothetical protein [Actinomadura luteofluorescens]
MTPAAVVALGALLFTVLSFWLLNARPGRLKSYEPHTFAAILGSAVRIRLPLVLHNTGALPIIVQNLRLCVPDDAPLLWITTRSQLKPASSDNHQFASVFHVPGRTAKEVFVEFGRDDPLAAKDYPVRVEVKLAHKDQWQPLVSFLLLAGQAGQPAYITYSNDPEIVPRRELEA